MTAKEVTLAAAAALALALSLTPVSAGRDLALIGAVIAGCAALMAWAVSARQGYRWAAALVCARLVGLVLPPARSGAVGPFLIVALAALGLSAVLLAAGVFRGDRLPHVSRRLRPR